MKFFVAICMLISVVSADYVVKNRDNLVTYRQECVKELSIPDDVVEHYKKWEYPNDSQTHSYLKCVFTKFGLFDENTGFNVEHLHEQLAGGKVYNHDDELHHKINACVDKNEQGSTSAEWAYRGATCLLKNHLAAIQQSLAPKA